jgi:NAD(P)H-hydrate epimerase
LALPAWPARDAAHLMVRAGQMAALEEELFASGLPVEALMEKAALAVVQRLRQADWWPRLQRRGALVLAGPGHNGGDGLVVARELHLAGVSVRIWSPFARRKPLCEAHRRHGLWLGIPELSQPPDPDDPAVWIDALLGIGQSRAPGDVLESLLEQRQQRRPGLLIAIDGPTGLCADAGRPLGRNAATAALSLSIGLIKQGFVQDTALRWIGALERIDLGLPPALPASLPAEQPLALTAADLATAPWPQHEPAASKYERGRLLVIAGSGAYPGAAQLWSRQPDVVLSAALGVTATGALQLSELPAMALERLDAIVIGPGLGTIGPDAGGADAPDHAGAASDAAATAPGTAAEDLSWARLQAFSGLLLLDADGINRLTDRAGPAEAIHWLRGRGGPTWLTPHPGEFQRLFPDLAVQPPLEAAARAAALSTGQRPCSLLLKGARSVIAAADGRRWQLSEASPAAARAGLGDVLAGYAGGLAARGLATAAADASLLATAALAHAMAGVQASREQGAGGATPMQVASYLAQITQ